MNKIEQIVKVGYWAVGIVGWVIIIIGGVCAIRNANRGV
jgi:preprotein translocase subunit Sss1